MDFSSAQILAHSVEYADILMSLMAGAKELSSEAYQVQRQHYINQANEMQIGCEIHFLRSGKRLMQNGALIPKDHQKDFIQILNTLTSSTTSLNHFDHCIEQLHSKFPQIDGWLAWWLHPKIASMIFPAKSTVDPNLAKAVPSTSNPVEGQHANLHYAQGTDFDALAGVHNLFLYIKQRESQYSAILEGHLNTPKAMRTNPCPKHHVHWDENDGRAPDTESALAKNVGQGSVSLSQSIVSGDLASVQSSLIPKSRLMRSYIWDNNSCFFDGGLELWFRMFHRSSGVERKEMLATLPPGTPLQQIFSHYQD